MNLEHDLNDMMVFLTVVEAGSFTLAAERLGIPKANVSRKVSRLEKRLNITLLERSTRSQHLTEAGQRFLIHCKRIHEELDLATACVSELQHGYTGRLKIGASVSTGHFILKPALSQFLKQFPDLNVQLNLLNRRVDFIEEGFDVVIRIGELEDSSLVAKKLGCVERNLYVSTSYAKENGLPDIVDELQRHQIITINPLTNDHRLQLVSKNGQRFALSSLPRLLVDDFAMLKQSVLDGIGIAALPSYMCQSEVEQGKLSQILLDWGLPTLDVFALYPKNRSKLPKVKAFLDFVEEVYKQKLN